MTSAPTKSDSPSEHIRKRSPILASRSDVSGSSSGWPVMTRVTTERCGWWPASSLEMRPSSTSCCTKEWSFVIWLKVSPRSMKARESPMWAIASLLPVRSMTMVVLPMPVRSALSRIALVSLVLALRSASSSRPTAWSAVTSSASSGASSPTIIELATSPAACPPMPSASTRRLGPAYPESSLRALGPRPRSERAA